MSKFHALINDPNSLRKLPDNELQAILLEGVSRTFALTIPQLPKKLHYSIANAYLLCRIIDTIEDEVSLSVIQKRQFCAEFIKVVKGKQPAKNFALALAPLLSKQTIPAEHTLINLLPTVISITHKLAPEQQEILSNCVEIMANGMPIFQALDLHNGLTTLQDMNNYCYYVAGCVGEMLAKLFCNYSTEIAERQTELLQLSVSFGQGLQMTNILKDIWSDAERGICWLPQDIFTATGFDLSQLTPQTDDPNFTLGLERLISIAHEHLQNALTFTQMLPKHETGIRNFCLWALGMAILSLQKIKKNLGFKHLSQVKINRTSVKAIIISIRLLGRSNYLLSALFNGAARGLKNPNWQYMTSSKLPPIQ